MKIVICGSRKYYDEIREAGAKLKEAGFIVFEPFLNRDTGIMNLSKNLKAYAFTGLTLHHFDLIRKSDICLIYNKDGYIGNSVTMELGYAVACALPIYAIEEDKDEPCRSVLFDFIVKDIDTLIKDLKQNVT